MKNYNKYIFVSLIIIIISSAAWTLFNRTTSDDSKPRHGEGAQVVNNHYSMIILKTKYGNIDIELLWDVAPVTCDRIVSLAKDGFYDGLSFHRVIDGFVAQTGDPTGTGRGGSGKKLKAELSSKKHEQGMVGMARGQSLNSADSQFYIMLGQATHLDNKYTIWGKVTKGMEHASKISQGDKIITAHPM